jgi:hypothetical protein
MALEAQKLSRLWVDRGRAELAPVALEVAEAAEIARSRGKSCTLQESGRECSRESSWP